MKGRMQKLILSVLVVLMVTALFSLGGFTDCAPAEEAPAPVVSEWNIPQLTILTGPGAFFGLEAKWGAERAVSEINAAGGIRGVPVKLTQYDTAYDPAKAVAATTRVVEDSLVILGPMAGTTGEAAAAIAVEEGVPIITSLCFPHVRQRFAPWGCSVYGDMGAGHVAAITEWLRLNPDIKSLVIFYNPPQISHVWGVEEIEKHLDEWGIELLGKIEATLGQLEWGPSAAKAMALNPDGYYGTINAEDQARLAKELYERGMTDGRRICRDCGSNSGALYELGKGYIEGSYIWDFYRLDYPSARWQAYVEAFKADHDNAHPYSMAIHGHYDAMYAIKAAFEACEITGDPGKLAEEQAKIKDFLYNTGNVEGIQGTWSWKNGQMLRPVYLFQIRDNVPVLVSTTSPE